MFSLFKSKSELEKLQKRYLKLMEKSHAISRSNRSEADKLFAEAEKVAKQIESYKEKQNQDA